MGKSERERESFYFRIVWPTAFDFLARVMAAERREREGKEEENKTSRIERRKDQQPAIAR